jgi:hypothetical protein
MFGKTDGTATFEYCMKQNSREVVDADNCPTVLKEAFNLCFTAGVNDLNKHIYF